MTERSIPLPPPPSRITPPARALLTNSVRARRAEVGSSCWLPVVVAGRRACTCEPSRLQPSDVFWKNNREESLPWACDAHPHLAVSPTGYFGQSPGCLPRFSVGLSERCGETPSTAAVWWGRPAAGLRARSHAADCVEVGSSLQVWVNLSPFDTSRRCGERRRRGTRLLLGRGEPSVSACVVVSCRR